MRIAMVAPVAQAVPPTKSGSVETLTALLTEGLVARGHDVTLFATATSVTSARLQAIYEYGYHEDTSMWPWELCELLNLAAAVECAGAFDLIHYQAEYTPISLAFTRVSSTPVLQTVHHAPTPPEVTLWSRYPDAPFVAVSQAQANLLAGLNVVAIIHHAVDTSTLAFQPDPDDYLLFLGRFTAGKGVLEAIEVARRTNRRLILAATENDYYREIVAPLVDGRQVVYAGEVDQAGKAELLGGARALLYPVPRRCLAVHRWRRWTAGRCPSLSTTASAAVYSGRSTHSSMRYRRCSRSTGRASGRGPWTALARTGWSMRTSRPTQDSPTRAGTRSE